MLLANHKYCYNLKFSTPKAIIFFEDLRNEKQIFNTYFYCGIYHYSTYSLDQNFRYV